MEGGRKRRERGCSSLTLNHSLFIFKLRERERKGERERE